MLLEQTHFPLGPKRPGVHDTRKIFAAYLDHECQIKGKPESRPETISIQFLNGFHHHGKDLQFQDFSILLKPLGKISDEDKASALLIEWYPYQPDPKYGECIEWGKTWGECLAKNNSMAVRLSVETYQFLQKKGYALPYGQWSVDELVEFGIYKLTV